MRRRTPQWSAVSLLATQFGLKEKFFCSTCGTVCERIEKLNAKPKDCVDPERLERFKMMLSALEPSN